MGEMMRQFLETGLVALVAMVGTVVGIAVFGPSTTPAPAAGQRGAYRVELFSGGEIARYWDTNDPPKVEGGASFICTDGRRVTVAGQLIVTEAVR